MKTDFPAHSMGVQGSFVILGILSVLLPLLLAPVRMRLTLKLTLRGGRGVFTLRFLLLRIRLRVRVHVFEEPYFTVEFINRLGKTFRLIRAVDDVEQKAPAWGKAALDALDIHSVRLNVLLGLRHAPAATALACGALSSVAQEALRLLLPDARRSVDIAPAYGQSAFLIKMDGIASVRAVHIIRQRLIQRGDESYGASIGNHFTGHGVGAKKSR